MGFHFLLSIGLNSLLSKRRGGRENRAGEGGRGVWRGGEGSRWLWGGEAESARKVLD